MDNSRQERREAAAFAKEIFELKTQREKKLTGMDLSPFSMAEAAIEAKLEAEAKFGVKIAISLDVEGNWWFQ